MNKDLLSEIRDANLNYLLLAQQMLRDDKATAIFRLGIDTQIAELIQNLSLSQLMKLAASNMMLARFRFEDSAVLALLANPVRESALTRAHAAILTAGQPVEEAA